MRRLLHSLTVSQRLLFAFGSATLMCAAIAALAIVQMHALAGALGTPEAFAASRRAAWLIGGLAAAASAGGVGVSLWIVRGLAGALGAEPQALGECARRVADGDLGGPLPAAGRGVMGDLARMQAQLVQLVGAVRGEADQVHAHGGAIAEHSRRQQSQAAEQSRALSDAAAALQREATSAQRGADATAQAAVQAVEAQRSAQQAQQVIGAAVERMQEVDQDARQIREAAQHIDRLAGQTGVLALNAAAAASRAGAAGAEFAVVAREVRALAVRCTEAAGGVQARIDAALTQIRAGREQVGRAGSAMGGIVGAAGVVADRLAALAAESRARGQALCALAATMDRLDAQTRDGAAGTARSGAAAQALARHSTRLVRSVAAFRLEPPPGAMLTADEDVPRHALDRRALQPGRG